MLKLEAASPPSRDLRAQQRTLQHFRHVYNCERPHEALANLRPSDVYASSARPFPSVEPEPRYERLWDVRRVDSTGRVTYRGYRIRIGKGLVHELLAFEPLGEHEYRIHFFTASLGLFDLASGRLTCPGGTRDCERYDVVG